MSSNVTEKTRIAQNRGTGHGADYIPWIFVSELPGHRGVHHNINDWKHGRQMQFLSNGELWQYLILRWDDDVIDIREQYPLELETTKEMFAMFKGFRHPSDKTGLRHMTSDLLVDYKDGHQEVFSVKYGRGTLNGDSPQTYGIIKRLWIEKNYWQGRNVKWHLVFTEEINRIYAENISQIIYYWDENTIVDKVSLFKYLVAHKIIQIDLESNPIGPVEFRYYADKYISDDEYTEYVEALHNMSE